MNTLHERLNNQNLDHFLVAEGGGAFGIGVEAGWMDEFRARGAKPEGLHGLGTSAGSWVLAMGAAGKQFEDIAGKEQIKLFNPELHYMRGYAKEIFGDARSEFVNATGSLIRFGMPELHVFHGRDHDLADMVTMSSSVPFAFMPAVYESRLYWDGAVAGVSAGYAHEAPRAKKLIALSALSTHLKVPVLGPLQGVAGKVLELKTDHELKRWQKQNPGSEVIHLKPNREIGSMVRTPRDVFNFRIGEEAYWMARGQMADLLDNEQDKPALINLRQQVMQLLVELSEPQKLSA